MYVSDELKAVLKDKLQESDYYFVLAEIEDAYEKGYRDGYGDCYEEQKAQQLRDMYERYVHTI